MSRPACADCGVVSDPDGEDRVMYCEDCGDPHAQCGCLGAQGLCAECYDEKRERDLDQDPVVCR